MNKDWFSVHPLWGWYPKTWEGYLLIALMFFAVGFSVFLASLTSSSIPTILLISFPWVSLIVSLTILIVSVKGATPNFGKKGDVNYSPDNPKAYTLLPFLIIPVFVVYLVIENFLGVAIFGIVFLLLVQLFRNLSAQKN